MIKRAFALALLAVTAACAPQSTVVLIPDADGHVGRIQVQGAGGAVLLDHPNTASVANAGEKPSPAKPLDEARIKQTWADALAAMPDRPVTFQLYFSSGTADLLPEAAELVVQAVDLAKKRPHVFIMIAGHADAVGSDEVNDRISRRRAEVVRNLVVERGLPPQAIVASSHGKRNPLVPTKDGVAEPRNRRVTLTLQ